MAQDRPLSTQRASIARKQGLSVPLGLMNGLIFTLGLWLALIGMFLLILH